MYVDDDIYIWMTKNCETENFDKKVVTDSLCYNYRIYWLATSLNFIDLEIFNLKFFQMWVT
jgi:hypothetical protein